MLDDAGINYLSVVGRAKSVTSFAAKAARTVDGVPAFTDPLTQITDQIGLRVITYVHSDVAAVADLLDDQVVVIDDRDMGRETASEGRFGYASRHLHVGLDAARESQPAYELLRGRRAQVQIRTVLQHAWAEFEHDIRYKGTIPDEHVPDFDRRFTLAAGLLELADREFSTIRDRLQAGMTEQLPTIEDDDPRISPRELAAFLAGQYADAGWSRTDHYAWISGLLLELGITSLVELGEVLPADRRRRAHRADGLPLPAGRRTPARRRAARRVRREVRRAARQRPPGAGAAGAAGEAGRRHVTGPGFHFDRVADVYRHARPDYPAEVYDLLTAHGVDRARPEGAGDRRRLRSGDGRAAARGCVVDAVEPGPALAETLRTRFADGPVTVIEATAEDVDLVDAAYDSVVAATALHWVDTATALPRLHAAVRPGGRLGVWWAVFADRDHRSAFGQRVDEIARRHGMADDDAVPRPLRIEERIAELEDGGWFGDVEAHVLRWSHEMTPAQVRALFTTFPTWGGDPALLDEVEAAARSLGDTVVDDYLCPVYVGRRRDLAQQPRVGRPGPPRSARTGSSGTGSGERELAVALAGEVRHHGALAARASCSAYDGWPR